MRLLTFLMCVWIGFGNLLKAQDFKYIDSTYVDNIKSVKLFPSGNPLLMPLVPLKGGNGIELGFDDLTNNIKDYQYTIIHCNANWTPTENLGELEYIDGYTSEIIRDAKLSFNTIMPYYHYTLQLPNSDLGWKLSGNYLLKITDPDTKNVVITRRFVVHEALMDIKARNVRTADQSKDRTHQEFDFEISYRDLPIRNPRTELSATAICNGRWDNAIYGLTPIFSRAGSVDFDYQDKIVFPAGKEYRFFDMRSLSYGGENVQNIRRVPDGYEAVLRPEKINTEVTYTSRIDIDGNFVIQCRDIEDCDTYGDYVYVFFSLKTPTEIEDNEIYVTGAFNEWQIKKEDKMIYNASKGLYEAEILLKQGYYNYQYTLFNPKTGVRDDYELQGNWHETENQFTVIGYYHPFGERYDRPIGVTNLDSRKY